MNRCKSYNLKTKNSKKLINKIKLILKKQKVNSLFLKKKLMLNFKEEITLKSNFKIDNYVSKIKLIIL